MVLARSSARQLSWLGTICLDCCPDPHSRLFEGTHPWQIISLRDLTGTSPVSTSMDQSLRKGSHEASTLRISFVGYRREARFVRLATTGTEKARTSHPTSPGSYIRTAIYSASAIIRGNFLGSCESPSGIICWFDIAFGA